MDSTRPYLLRAIYEWCIDQGYTPFLDVRVDRRTRVPPQHVRDGRIVLNIGADAAHALVMGNECITLAARFGGVAQELSIPVDRVAAIYARENGQGMAFEVSEAPQAAETPEAPEATEATEASDATGRSEPPRAAEVPPAADGKAPDAPGKVPPASTHPHLVRIK